MAQFMILTAGHKKPIVVRNLCENIRAANLLMRDYAETEQWFLNTTATIQARPFYFRKSIEDGYFEYMWKQSLGIPVAL